MPRRGVIVGIAVAILAVTLWLVTQKTPAPELRLSPLTFDTGLTTTPAISSKGDAIAYASDRDTGTNLELYVQQLPSGSPVRLTSTPEDESFPDFSPDGATILYTSSKNGGEIYSLPIAGGDPRLLAAGRAARYSPDGHEIVFEQAGGWYLMPSSGGPPARFHAGITATGSASWSPDGQSLLLWAGDDFQIAGHNGGPLTPSGVRARMAAAGLATAPPEDASWTSDGLAFTARTGFVRNMYLCPLSPAGKASGAIERLTNGTESMDHAVVSAQHRVVLTSGRQRFDLWGLTLDPSTGKAVGGAVRITDTLAPTATPALSADGKKLLYGSSRNGFTQVWERVLATGTEQVVATGPEGASYGVYLRNSDEILSIRPSAGHDELYQGTRKIAGGSRAWDVDHAGKNALVIGLGIEVLDLATGQRTNLIRAGAKEILGQASFSPDDRWVLFTAAGLAKKSKIYVSPSKGGDRLPITDGDKPRFSSDGRFLYFTVDSRRSRSIQAIRFDAVSGKTIGDPFLVFESQRARLSLFDVNPSAFEITVAANRLVTIFCETSTNLWMGDLVLAR